MDPEKQDKLKKKLQIQTWDQVDESRGQQVVEQVQSGQITKEEWDYLRVVVPKFMDVVSAGLTATSSISTSIASSQTEALKAINEGIKAARDIANGSNDTAVKIKALETIEKGFKKAERMNKKNNNVWKQAFKVVVVLVSGAVGVATIGRRLA